MEKRVLHGFRSEEAREVLEAPPGWLIRRGSLLVAVFFLLLLLLAWLIRYPDVITAPVALVSPSPPVTVHARTTGFLRDLPVTDQQEVKKGDLLGIIASAASPEDIFFLGEWLVSHESPAAGDGSLAELRDHGELRLGDARAAFAAFMAALREYNNVSTHNLLAEKGTSLRVESAGLEKYRHHLERQVEILGDRVAISRKQLNRDSSLFRVKTISEIELEKSRAEFLDHESRHRAAVASLAEAEMKLSGVHRLMTETKSQEGEQQERLRAAVIETAGILRNALEEWEYHHLLRSPADGRVTFTGVWSELQEVRTGDAVFAVVPAQGEEVMGRMLLPVARSGKVVPGQAVRISLENFPAPEYGMLRGKVARISLVPAAPADGPHYVAWVTLDQGLTTDTGRQLPAGTGMSGDARVITHDRSLLARLTAPLVSLATR